MINCQQLINNLLFCQINLKNSFGPLIFVFTKQKLQNEKKAMNQHYELAYIVPINYLEDELQKVNDEVSALIKQFGGEITRIEDMGKRRLAYQIEQVFQGSYYAIEFDMESENAEQFDLKLKQKKEILRHMVVKKKIKSAEEIERENKIQEGLRTSKQDELNKIEADEKAAVKKSSEEETPAVVAAAASAKKEASKAKLEDLDKKLDEILKDDII